MRSNSLARLVEIFHSLASAEVENLPDNSKDLGVVLKNLENLETYSARQKYAGNNLERLSSGSSRIVYLTEDKTVIKLARNDKGIAQNKAEAKLDTNSKYINKVLRHADNYSWVEAKFLDKLTSKQFEELTGFDFDDFGAAIRYGLREVSGNTDKEKPDNFEKIKQSEIYKELVEVGKKYHLLGGDMARLSSFGLKNNHPVLIDGGLSKEVFESYYESNSSS